MKGSEFAASFGRHSPAAWEAAAFELERSGKNLKPVFVSVPLAHKDGRKAVIDVSSDYFSVGESDDFIRLPLMPGTAQKIANLTGCLLPTPKLVYRIWQASTKLTRMSIAGLGETNKGANFAQYVKHNNHIQSQVVNVPRGSLISGHKKDVVVGNASKPGKVLIFGWYKPSPDVFDDGQAYTAPDRQPQQAYSNVHGDFYVDYSHGIRFVSPLMRVEGKEVETAQVYTDANLFDFVSHEPAPVKQPRYPAPFPEGGPRKPQAVSFFDRFRPNLPGYATLGTQVLIAHSRRG